MNDDFVNIVKIQNGFTVNYNSKSYYCKSIAQVSKLLKEIFPEA